MTIGSRRFAIFLRIRLSAAGVWSVMAPSADIHSGHATSHRPRTMTKRIGFSVSTTPAAAGPAEGNGNSAKAA
jgi:hypothetical protein